MWEKNTLLNPYVSSMSLSQLLTSGVIPVDAESPKEPTVTVGPVGSIRSTDDIDSWCMCSLSC